MTTPSPLKPWERNAPARTSSSLTTTTAPASSAAPSAVTSPPAAATSTSGAPTAPDRPSNLTSVANRNASTYSTMNRPYGGYGSSPYGGYGSSPYGLSSPYSRFGGGMTGGMYGSSMYGGGMYGGAGGMYGGGMYGGGGYGAPYGGMPGDPNEPNNSLTNNFAQSTQATFQIIESIVGAFGGFAQMLESTYMATHSSFFAMVSVAEQFGNLRQTLGSVLGIYAVLRWMRTLIAKLTGRPPPADATSLTPAAFAAFASGQTPSGAVGSDGRPIPRPSKKPFIVFLLAVFGLPYLMGKLIRTLARNQTEMQQQQHQQQGGAPQLDPTQLDFCRVQYDYPQPGAAFDAAVDLEVKAGDLVAVLDKPHPDWWRCRARDGRVGHVPATWLQTIARRREPAQITAQERESRANTMPGSVAGLVNGKINDSNGTGVAPAIAGKANTMSGASRASTMVSAADGKKQGELEKMQKAWANDR